MEGKELGIMRVAHIHSRSPADQDLESKFPLFELSFGGLIVRMAKEC